MMIHLLRHNRNYSQFSHYCCISEPCYKNVSVLSALFDNKRFNLWRYSDFIHPALIVKRILAEHMGGVRGDLNNAHQVSVKACGVCLYAAGPHQ